MVKNLRSRTREPYTTEVTEGYFYKYVSQKIFGPIIKYGNGKGKVEAGLFLWGMGGRGPGGAVSLFSWMTEYYGDRDVTYLRQLNV